MINSKQFKLIHDAIHSWDGKTNRIIKLNGKRYQLYITPNAQCRNVSIEGFRFIEQNCKSQTHYGTLAREGHQITWAIPISSRGKRWGKIIDGNIEEPIPEVL